MIRLATSADAENVSAIYNHYVLNSVSTLEERPVSPEDVAQRIEAVRSKSLPWLVDEEAGAVVAYAYVAPWLPEDAYRFTLETSIYIHPDYVSMGRGTKLFAALLEMLPDTGAHSAMALIVLPNPASAALHERHGFTKVGHFSEVKFRFGRWMDVGMWEARL